VEEHLTAENVNSVSSGSRNGEITALLGLTTLGFKGLNQPCAMSQGPHVQFYL
jgi:hypothetical protein